MFTRSILHSMNATKHMATIVYRRFHPGVLSTFAGPLDRGSGVGMAALRTSLRGCRQRTQWYVLFTGTTMAAPGCPSRVPRFPGDRCCTAQIDALAGNACLTCPAPRTLPIRRTRRAGIIADVIDVIDVTDVIGVVDLDGANAVADITRDAGCRAGRRLGDSTRPRIYPVRCRQRHAADDATNNYLPVLLEHALRSQPITNARASRCALRFTCRNTEPECTQSSLLSSGLAGYSA